MSKSGALRASLLVAGAIVFASCASTADEPANADGSEELTGIHAGETAEEHAAHVEQDRIDQAAEEAAAEAASNG